MISVLCRQSWIALPDEQQECEPSFLHYPEVDLPEFDIDGVTLRIIMGEAYAHSSPVLCHSPTLYLECRLPAGTQITLPDTHAELAVYVVDGNILIDQKQYAGGLMAVARTGRQIRLQADKDSHVMVIGGEPLGKATHLVELCGKHSRAYRAGEDRLEGRTIWQCSRRNGVYSVTRMTGTIASKSKRLRNRSIHLLIVKFLNFVIA